MAHRLSAEAESDLDDIWVYLARQSGSLETADRLIRPGGQGDSHQVLLSNSTCASRTTTGKTW